MASKDVQLDGSDARISLSQLESLVHAACPNAYFVVPRVLRRIIKFDRKLTGVVVDAPHSKCYVVHHERLLKVADRNELYPRPEGRLPEQVILISRPEEEKLSTITRDEALVRSWRLLFHSQIHYQLEGRLASGDLTRNDVYARIHEIGQGQFDEIRNVLRQERLLLPPYDDVSTYVEFAAIFFELKFFAPGALVQYFPGLRDVDRIEELVGQDVEATLILDYARPETAPDPKELTVRLFGGLDPEDAEHEPEPRSQRKFLKLTHRARVVAAMGNTVRAAILRMKAAELTSPSRAERTRSEANGDIEVLVQRLQSALGFGEAEEVQWHGALWALLEQCPRGVWTTEARLLYDLQKVCNDHEREIYTIDVVSWALSRGRRPIKRPLPSQRDVLMCKHLKGAASRLTAVRIAPNFRRVLSRLLGHASQLAEENLRRHFRPKIDSVFREVGLDPSNVPEAVGRKKLIEELIDRVAQHGFLTAGDLRDGISRNSLKVPDLSGMRELVKGDRLLRTDRQLTGALDGVYQPGEFYRRGFQRLSAAAFGNRYGRMLTRFLLLPFLGAFVIIEGLRHLVELFYHPAWLEHFTLIKSTEPHKSASVPVVGLAVETAAIVRDPMVLAAYVVTLALLGFFILGLVNFEAFRMRVAKFFQSVRRFIFKAVDTIIAWIHLPIIQQILRSRWFRLLGSVIVKPSIFTFAIWAWLRVWDIQGHDSPLLLACLFCGANVITNSRFGRDMEEVAKDWAVESWRKFRVHVLSGLFQLIMDIFKGLIEAVDRVLYTVDEWLRFRSGESTMALAVKGVLGIIWFAITYVTRFCVNLLIEPQINPIKHFPAVTVAHKILLPTIPLIAGALASLLGDPNLALGVATVFVFCIPGVFGFLVWELKENWRLYDANRPRTLRPCQIGHHGETMTRLLKPGIHSGTLPRIYRRLRRAERKAQWTGERRSARKYLHQLAEVKHALRHFVEREFCQLLESYPEWEQSVVPGEIRMASNSLHIEILCPEIGPESFWFEVDLQSGWLIARIADPGWLVHTDADQRVKVRNALLGLLKLSGVTLSEQQIQALFRPTTRFDIVDDGLLVWPADTYEIEWLYDLDVDRGEPQVKGTFEESPPRLSHEQIMFRESDLEWQEWVVVWDEASPERLIPDVPLLGTVPERITAPTEVQ